MGKKTKFKLTIQEIIIIILLLGYITIYYAYDHDVEQYKNLIKQYKEIVENPQQLCYQYYEYLNQRSVNKEEVMQNFTKLFEDLIVDNPD